MHRLEWGDCFSYGDDNSIDLSGSTITQLIGENGSGKSSIALIIQEVLFNKNSKGVKKSDIANRNIGDGKYWIKLYFSLNDQDYTINLTRTSSLKVKLFKGDEDLSSHTATETFKTIEKLIGVDFKVFVQLMYQSINDGLSFLTATDTVRKKFLIDLFDLNEYTKYFDIFKALTQSAAKEVTSLEGSIASLEKVRAKSDNLPEPKLLKDLPPKPEYPKEVGELEAKISNISATNKRISQNEQLKRLLKNIVVELEYLSKDLEDTGYLNSKIGELKARENALKAFIVKLSKLNDTCPTCHQPIDISKEKALKEDNEKELNEIKIELAEAQEQLKKATELNAKISEAKKARDNKEDLLQRIDQELPSEPLEASELQKEIDGHISFYRLLEKDYEEVAAYNRDVDQFNKKIELLKEQREELLTEITENKLALQDAIHKQSIYEILKKIFSTNGLVAYKLENLVKDIEEATNSYLLELSDGRFSIFFTISGDKLNVTLNDGDNEIDISALSSGELARVNTSTLLAIRKIMSSISKTQINILFLDEVINVLDEYGRERLVEVLLEEKSLNTFLVSHGWSHPLLAKINVVKTDGISELKEQ